MVLETLSKEIRSRHSEELLYAGDLALVSKIREGLNRPLEAWKGAFETKRLRVNVKKTKMMASSENAGKVKLKASFLVLFAERV